MRQYIFGRPFFHLALVLIVLLLGSGETAMAMPNRLLLQSEQSFQAQLGGRAVQISTGVYRVQLPSGEQIDVAFGREGLKYDIARLRTEISVLRARKDATHPPISRRLLLLTRALGNLEQQLAEQENPGRSSRSVTTKAAVDGPVCSGYGFHLDGGHNPGMVGGTTWGEANVEPDGFGPYPPAYRCVAYSYAATTDEYDNFFYDEDVEDQLGSASAAASVNCGFASWSCPMWESFNWIHNYGCFDGYRSIHRTQSNPN